MSCKYSDKVLLKKCKLTLIVSQLFKKFEFYIHSFKCNKNNLFLYQHKLWLNKCKETRSEKARNNTYLSHSWYRAKLAHDFKRVFYSGKYGILLHHFKVFHMLERVDIQITNCMTCGIQRFNATFMKATSNLYTQLKPIHPFDSHFSKIYPNIILPSIARPA